MYLSRLFLDYEDFGWSHDWVGITTVPVRWEEDEWTAKAPSVPTFVWTPLKPRIKYRSLINGDYDVILSGSWIDKKETIAVMSPFLFRSVYTNKIQSSFNFFNILWNNKFINYKDIADPWAFSLKYIKKVSDYQLMKTKRTNVGFLYFESDQWSVCKPRENKYLATLSLEAIANKLIKLHNQFHKLDKEWWFFKYNPTYFYPSNCNIASGRRLDQLFVLNYKYKEYHEFFVKKLEEPLSNFYKICETIYENMSESHDLIKSLNSLGLNEQLSVIDQYESDDPLVFSIVEKKIALCKQLYKLEQSTFKALEMYEDNRIESKKFVKKLINPNSSVHTYLTTLYFEAIIKALFPLYPVYEEMYYKGQYSLYTLSTRPKDNDQSTFLDLAYIADKADPLDYDAEGVAEFKAMWERNRTRRTPPGEQFHRYPLIPYKHRIRVKLFNKFISTYKYLLSTSFDRAELNSNFQVIIDDILTKMLTFDRKLPHFTYLRLVEREWNTVTQGDIFVPLSFWCKVAGEELANFMYLDDLPALLKKKNLTLWSNNKSILNYHRQFFTFDSDWYIYDWIKKNKYFLNSFDKNKELMIYLPKDYYSFFDYNPYDLVYDLGSRCWLSSESEEFFHIYKEEIHQKKSLYHYLFKYCNKRYTIVRTWLSNLKD